MNQPLLLLKSKLLSKNNLDLKGCMFFARLLKSTTFVPNKTTMDIGFQTRISALGLFPGNLKVTLLMLTVIIAGGHSTYSSLNSKI